MTQVDEHDHAAMNAPRTRIPGRRNDFFGIPVAIQPHLWNKEVRVRFRWLQFALLYAIPVLILSITTPIVILGAGMGVDEIWRLVAAKPMWMPVSYFATAFVIGMLIGLYHYSNFLVPPKLASHDHAEER